MATAASPTRAIASFPPVRSKSISNGHVTTGVSSHEIPTVALRSGLTTQLSWKPTRLKAKLTEIEPDLQEDPIDRWRTNGVEPEDFVYGIYDGAHTYNEGDEEKKGFWEAVAEQYNGADPPTGFQGLISWLFLPAVIACFVFDWPKEYMFIGAALFVVVFCAIEMEKPDKPHNFEPHIYNMERGARDKMIAEYNSMDIWDFNEKYGDLWDFTLDKKEIIKNVKS
ncbi:Photosynthetic NDH subunit of subcomplex B 5 [Carex littledalei]|uniref:Photosynthetic NDH subunit of subcomplex B 5 n=1 Tax=Carex littledalei TaxID=544730 RepID=A0A833VGK0_9POAL|nr:Photosynthetic NDH subunit of subcomplex B 5 [Carex littledalei]